jgi:hypothetical protein
MRHYHHDDGDDDPPAYWIVRIFDQNGKVCGGRLVKEKPRPKLAWINPRFANQRAASSPK